MHQNDSVSRCFQKLAKNDAPDHGDDRSIQQVFMGITD